MIEKEKNSQRSKLGKREPKKQQELNTESPVEPKEALKLFLEHCRTPSGDTEADPLDQEFNKLEESPEMLWWIKLLLGKIFIPKNLGKESMDLAKQRKKFSKTLKNDTAKQILEWLKSALKSKQEFKKRDNEIISWVFTSFREWLTDAFYRDQGLILKRAKIKKKTGKEVEIEYKPLCTKYNRLIFLHRFCKDKIDQKSVVISEVMDFIFGEFKEKEKLKILKKEYPLLANCLDYYLSDDARMKELADTKLEENSEILDRIFEDFFQPKSAKRLKKKEKELMSGSKNTMGSKQDGEDEAKPGDLECGNGFKLGRYHRVKIKRFGCEKKELIFILKDFFDLCDFDDKRKWVWTRWQVERSIERFKEIWEETKNRP